MLSNHKNLSDINRELLDGASVAETARKWGINNETLKTHARKLRRLGPPEVELQLDQVDDPSMAAAIEAARAEAESVGGVVRRVTFERRASTWDAQTGKGQIDELEASRHGARITVELPSEGGRVEVRQAEPINIKLSMPRPPRRDKGECRTAIVLPDMQYPFHDAAAVDVAEQLLAYVEQTEGVDDVVWLGDNLDFPEVGRHRTAPSLIGSMQTGIDGYYRHMARVRAISPEASAYWLLGNHEQRITDWLVDNNATLLSLYRAGEQEDPVLSVEFLCRARELDVNVVGPYPEGTVWLTSSLRLEHGRFTGPHPEAKYLQEIEASTIYGHTHRAVLAYREVDRGPRGLRSYFSGSPGCLCRLDGRLPSAKSGIDSKGRPGLSHAETWQQGVMVIRYNPNGGEMASAHIVRIINGRAEWEGRLFTAKCDVDGSALPDAA